MFEVLKRDNMDDNYIGIVGEEIMRNILSNFINVPIKCVTNLQCAHSYFIVKKTLGTFAFSII